MYCKTDYNLSHTYCTGMYRVCIVQYILVSCQGREALPVCHATPPDTDGPIFTGTQEKAVLVEGQTGDGTCMRVHQVSQKQTSRWVRGSSYSRAQVYI